MSGARTARVLEGQWRFLILPELTKHPGYKGCRPRAWSGMFCAFVWGMLVAVAVLFSRPDPETRVTQARKPVLEGWMAAGHPDQQRLSSYLDDLEVLAGSSCC